MTSPLETSRAMLLRAVRGEPRAKRRPGAFPRSKAMQMAMDPRYHWLRVALIAAGTIALQRMIPARSGGLLVAGAAVVRRALNTLKEKAND